MCFQLELLQGFQILIVCLSKFRFQLFQMVQKIEKHVSSADFCLWNVGAIAGVLGHPAILPSDSRIPLTMGEYVNLSILGHT